MNRETYIARVIAEFGGSEKEAVNNIGIAKSDNPDDVGMREFNFVPVGGGLYEIWNPGDRGGYTKEYDHPGEVFRGTLDEAYEYVFEKMKRSIENSPTAQRLIAERRAAEGQ